MAARVECGSQPEAVVRSSKVAPSGRETASSRPPSLPPGGRGACVSGSVRCSGAASMTQSPAGDREYGRAVRRRCARRPPALHGGCAAEAGASWAGTAHRAPGRGRAGAESEPAAPTDPDRCASPCRRLPRSRPGSEPQRHRPSRRRKRRRRLALAAARAFLAPDLGEAILDGTQPVALTAERLKRTGELPLLWDEQRAMLGVDDLEGGDLRRRTGAGSEARGGEAA